MEENIIFHYDAMEWERFPHYWLLVRQILRSRWNPSQSAMGLLTDT